MSSTMEVLAKGELNDDIEATAAPSDRDLARQELTIARKYIGALSAVLSGLDTIVFTGGIGERAAPVRWMICHGLDYLGVSLDPGKNDANAEIISTDNSHCSVRVIHTNEDLMIARHTRELLLKAGEGEK